MLARADKRCVSGTDHALRVPANAKHLPTDCEAAESMRGVSCSSRNKVFSMNIVKALCGGIHGHQWAPRGVARID